ncbi:hypothetical protein [Sphingomonas jaspsi]|uniref:hypothetical protein n=1 Tax=Sphingomonas jaspsi TaxID=392409 RepID=UPI0004AC86A6|nr:hypothetical protein [Sphingomonas jaspsi]
MPRWLRILLTALAAGIGGWAGLITFGGGAAGVAWLFLFGDDPWPQWGEWLILAVAFAGAVAGAAGLGLAAWRATGNKWD